MVRLAFNPSFEKTFSKIKDNTLKDSYEKTIVVVLTKAAQDAGSNLAKLLNGAISELPAGEIKPSGADLLIILGKDKI